MATINEQPNTALEITEKDVIVKRAASVGDELGALEVEYSEDAAVALVVQDAQRCDAFLDKQWALIWRENNILEQSPRSLSAWQNTGVTKANVNRFLVATHLNSLVPKIISTLFYDDPPFELTPAEGTTENTVRARKEVIAALLRKMEFRNQAKRGSHSFTLHGTGIWKWGVTRKKEWKANGYKRKAAPQKVETAVGTQTIPTKESQQWEVDEELVETWQVWFKRVNHRYALVDVDLEEPDIREADWVVWRSYLNFYQLEDLRGDPNYDLPLTDELKKLFFPPVDTPPAPGQAEQQGDFAGGMAGLHHAERRYMESSADPLLRPMEVLEREAPGSIIVVLDRKKAIRNTNNDYGKIKAYSANFWDIDGSFWGFGVGRIVGQDQRIKTGLTNGGLDIIAHNLQPDYVVSKSANVATQQIPQYLGGITRVDGDVRTAFALKEQPKVQAEVLAFLQQATAEAESATGANELLVQGSLPSAGRTSMGRNATGASLMGAASDSRIQGPIDNFVFQVFIPFLYELDALVRKEMPMSQIKAICGERLGKDFVLDEEEFLNSEFQFSAKAGALLAARQRMAQSIGFMIQLFEAPNVLQHLAEVNQEFVDIGELLEEMRDVSGWGSRRSVIKPMTPKMKQQQQQRLQAQNKLAGQMQLEQLRQQGKSADIDQKAQDRIVERILVEQGLQNEEGEETSGEPVGAVGA